MARMTVDLLTRCTGQARRKRGESCERLLARITHLHCSGKGIHTIEGLSGCHALSVLYLYDNHIASIGGLASCGNLTHIYLQNNHISSIEGLDHLHRLSKLYLSDNGISVVEGLEECRQLTELHVAHQRLSEGEKLLFDPRTLQAIASSLVLLNVSGNCLDSLQELSSLKHLTTLIATENNLSSMKDLAVAIPHWPEIERVELTGNPLCSKHKYRDRVITMGTNISRVDGREVSETERQFLACWKATRKARRKAQRLNKGSQGLLFPSAQHDPRSHQPAPLTMPALPARLPLRHSKRNHKDHGEQDLISLPSLVPRQSAFTELSPSHPIKHTPTSSHRHHKSTRHTLTTSTTHSVDIPIFPQILQSISS